MQASFPLWLDFVLRPNMDGQTYHVTPGDPGGGTSEGILFTNAVAYEKERGRTLTLTQFKSWTLTTPDVAAFYKSQMWDYVRGDDMPIGVDGCLFNIACGSYSEAPKLLQQVLGVTVDGAIGPQTMAAVKAADSSAVIEGLQKAYLAFLSHLTSWPEFKNGWTLRVNQWAEFALGLIEAEKGTMT
jgi:lysozyme family protein